MGIGSPMGYVEDGEIGRGEVGGEKDGPRGGGATMWTEKTNAVNERKTNTNGRDKIEGPCSGLALWNL